MKDVRMNNADATDLQVRGESVQSLYANFLRNQYLVNRRYQRKLVWATAEKMSFIESISQKLPVPLLLFAESDGRTLEIIDGMQRINALTSFIENKFSLGRHYFDLEALADTKDLSDRGLLRQNSPVLDRERSRQIANYQVPVSIFRPNRESDVDDAFRRINSGGRQISRQELRQAGTLTSAADIVRRLSIWVRGDITPGDMIPLSKMPEISLGVHDLDYGVNSDDILWVKQGILRRDDLRGSADEQLVLDLLADCYLQPRIIQNRESRDRLYGFIEQVADIDLKTQLETALGLTGAERVEADFQVVIDEFKSLMDCSDRTFARLIGIRGGGRAPRYFHAVYVAMFELMISEHKRPSSRDQIVSSLRDAANSFLDIPGGSGTWTSDSRETAIAAVKGVLGRFFVEDDRDVHGREIGALALENALRLGRMESQQFELKQGLCALRGARTFQDATLKKVVRTLTAMSNLSRQQEGILILGVADDASAAASIREVDGVNPVEFQGSHIVGLDREAAALNLSIQQYLDKIVRKIRTLPDVSDEYRSAIVRGFSVGNYHGHSYAILRAPRVSDPVEFDGQMYVRSFSDVNPVRNGNLRDLYREFYSSGSHLTTE